MFESQMVENIKAINNPWRDLVTPQFKAFLDSFVKDNTLSTSKEDTTEDSEL